MLVVVTGTDCHLFLPNDFNLNINLIWTISCLYLSKLYAMIVALGEDSQDVIFQSSHFMYTIQRYVKLFVANNQDGRDHANKMHCARMSAILVSFIAPQQKGFKNEHKNSKY